MSALKGKSEVGSDRIRTEGLDSCFDAFSSREPDPLRSKTLRIANPLEAESQPLALLADIP